MKQTDLTYRDAPSSLFDRADALMAHNAEALDLYLDRLLWWNQRVNLVSRSVPRETITQHIRHSLLVGALGPFEKASNVVDAGTGGGLPGLPLAICHPDKRFVLNDIVTKKVLAVRQMVRKLDLKNVRVVDGSLEDLTLDQTLLLLSKHSFKLDEILRLSRHLPWKEMILYKGEEIVREVKSLPSSLRFDVQVLRLQEVTGDPFYKGKALVVLQHRDSE